MHTMVVMVVLKHICVVQYLSEDGSDPLHVGPLLLAAHFANGSQNP